MEDYAFCFECALVEVEAAEMAQVISLAPAPVTRH